MKKRLFIAVKIHGNKALETLVKDTKTKLKGNKLRWIDLGNLHLTLKFIGKTKEEKVSEIIEALSSIETNFSPFEIELSKLKAFYSKNEPKILWIDVKNKPEISELSLSINNALEAIDIKNNEKKYTPHLTIARIKQVKNIEKYKDLFNENFIFSLKYQISEFHLIESDLKPTGVQYYVLKTFVLNSART